MNPMGGFKKKGRRILTRFRLNEISAVDHPAQLPALAALIKHQIIEEDGPSGTIVVADSMTKTGPTFLEQAALLRKRDGLSPVEALRKTRQSFPELYEALQSDIIASGPEVAKTRPTAVREFQNIVDEIASTEKVSKTQAMQIARRSHPVEFEALQNT